MMIEFRLPSSSLPQADSLPDVLRTVEAVGKGLQSFQEIAEYIGKVDRQGRYYRLAAELLGFIVNHQNNATLTEAGHRYLEASDFEKAKLVSQAVLHTAVVQRLLPFLQSHPQGISREQLEQFVSIVTEPDVGSTMVGRRITTILNWLRETQIISESQRIIQLMPLHSLINEPIGFIRLDEPLLARPNPLDFKTYEVVQRRTRDAQKTINVIVDQVKIERANQAHQHLIHLLFERLKRIGSIPTFNPLIDLAVNLGDVNYLFEMKSNAEGNTRSQIRRGISQLYEYRYLQDLPDAKLLLVLEKPLPKRYRWMLEYLETDRQIYLLWDGDEQIHASKRSQAELAFLFE
jgi:hypothetical protein